MGCARCYQYHYETTPPQATHLASVAQAAVERVRGVVSGHVPLASHNVVNVLAKRGGLGAVLAGAEAELGVGHEVLRSEILSNATLCRSA